MKEYRDEFKRVEKDAYWSLPRVFLYAAAILLGAYTFKLRATGGEWQAAVREEAPKR